MFELLADIISSVERGLKHEVQLQLTPIHVLALLFNALEYCTAPFDVKARNLSESFKVTLHVQVIISARFDCLSVVYLAANQS